MSDPIDTLKVEGIPIVLLDSCVQVGYAEGRTKLISYEALLESLQASVSSATESTLLEVFLPDNTFYFAQTATQIKISLYFPEHVVPLEFEGDGMGPTPRLLPNMIISFLLVRSTAKGTRAYTLSGDHAYFLCTHMSRLELPRKFYTGPVPGETALLPVSNLYDNARMCYGANQRLADFKLPDLRPLISYYYTLTGSPFNRDLGVRAISGAFSTEGWFREIARLAKAGLPFPYKTVGLST